MTTPDGPPWPPLDALDIADPDAYVWLLSAHPWAVAERARRRADHHRRELAEAAEVLAITDRLRAADLDAGHPLARLADTVAPTANTRALAAEVDRLQAEARAFREALAERDEATALLRRRMPTIATRRAASTRRLGAAGA